jgi:hypothetical protein
MKNIVTNIILVMATLVALYALTGCKGQDVYVTECIPSSPDPTSEEPQVPSEPAVLSKEQLGQAFYAGCLAALPPKQEKRCTGLLERYIASLNETEE